MRTKIIAATGIVHLVIALLLSLTFLCARPIAASGSALGFTPTPTPSSTPTPTPSSSPPGPTPGPPPSLQLVKEVQATQVVPGGIVVYTILVENLGPGPATGVMVVDDLPPQLEVLEASATRGEVIVEGNRVAVTVGVLGEGYASTITITARVRADTPPGVQVENVAVAWSDQTGEVTRGVVITVSGFLPEAGGEGGGMVWLGIAFGLLGAGLVGLEMRCKSARGFRS